MEEERRIANIDIRMINKNGEPVIGGLAAVFNSLSEDLGGFREQIAPGAFRAALDVSDPRCLFNHEASMVLGRVSSGTLRLNENDKGLEFECDIPGTSYAKDLMTCMKRGDIDQCSFGFSVDEGGDSWNKDSNGKWIRTINKVAKLYDVSLVTFPAYPSTECALRLLDKVKTNCGPCNDDMQLRKMRLEIEEAYSGRGRRVGSYLDLPNKRENMRELSLRLRREQISNAF